MKKPSKTGIYMFAVTAVLYAAASTAYFLNGAVGWGAFWAVLTVVWIVMTFKQHQIWRIRVETFELTRDLS